MLDNGLYDILFGSKKEHFIAIAAGHPNQLLHQVDAGYPFLQRFAQQSRRPYYSLTICVDEIRIDHAFPELRVLLHRYDLSGIDHGMMQVAAVVNGGGDTVEG